MKTNLLVLVLITLLAALVGMPLHADGFIVVNQPVAVPWRHFSFAPLEVSYHHVDVKIDGQICTTTVDEEFYNPNPMYSRARTFFPFRRTRKSTSLRCR